MKAIRSDRGEFYAFDPFLVDAVKRVLLRDGKLVPLTPKAFEILLALIRHRARVLKKEELFQLVWPDAFVEENNLPRNVSALRKALGEEPTEHKYVATVPGQGYRFVASVRELETLDEGESPPPLVETATPSISQNGGAREDHQSNVIPIPTRARYPRVVLAATVVIALVSGLFATAYLEITRWSRPTGPSPQRKLWQLTFEPGLESEPTWSPDGRFIAFSSDQSGNFDIWVRPVGEGKPIQVTTSPAHDWQPDWSPDGRSLVFRSERDGGGLFVTPALGGNERKLSSVGYHPRWSPDGSQILFFSAADPSFVKSKMYVMSAEGGPPREVLPGLVAEFVSPPRVAWHPDSQRLSIWGNHRQFGWSFWTVPLTNFAPVQSAVDPSVAAEIKEAAISFRDFVWSPSGQSLIFEGESQGVRNLWKISVDAQTLRWVNGPERLTTSAGIDTDIALSSDGRKLAFTVRSEKSRLWSLPFDSVSGRVTGNGEPITNAGMDAQQPGLSQDGRKLIFLKQRADKEELWIKSLDDGTETLLVPADDFRRVNPILSHDGSRLLYLRSRPAGQGQREGDPQIDRSLALRSVDGNDEQVLTSPAPGRQSLTDWTPDGKWILASSDWRTPGQVALCLFPVDAAPNAETKMRVIASHPEYHLWQGRFSPDGIWISFNAFNRIDGTSSTIYVMAPSGGPWIPITDGKYWDDKPRWSPDGKTIYFVSNRTGFLNVWKVRFDPTNGKHMDQPSRVTDFESPAHMIMPNFVIMEIALTSDRLILPMTERSGGIWIMENVER
jgi:Tol biopolymer transport system component/DNA-binding winged helix-turn-helix (wHTH) protein